MANIEKYKQDMGININDIKNSLDGLKRDFGEWKKDKTEIERQKNKLLEKIKETQEINKKLDEVAEESDETSKEEVKRAEKQLAEYEKMLKDLDTEVYEKKDDNKKTWEKQKGGKFWKWLKYLWLAIWWFFGLRRLWRKYKDAKKSDNATDWKDKVEQIDEDKKKKKDQEVEDTQGNNLEDTDNKTDDKIVEKPNDKVESLVLTAEEITKRNEYIKNSIGKANRIPATIDYWVDKKVFEAKWCPKEIGFDVDKQAIVAWDIILKLQIPSFETDTTRWRANVDSLHFDKIEIDWGNIKLTITWTGTLIGWLLGRTGASQTKTQTSEMDKTKFWDIISPYYENNKKSYSLEIPNKDSKVPLNVSI